MKKSIFRADTNHILLNSASGDTIKLDAQGGSYVVGISVENQSTSDGNLIFGLNEPPKISMAAGGGARQYGGLSVDNMPLVYTGEFNYRYAAGTTQFNGLLVVTRMVPVPIDCVEWDD